MKRRRHPLCPVGALVFETVAGFVHGMHGHGHAASLVSRYLAIIIIIIAYE